MSDIEKELNLALAEKELLKTKLARAYRAIEHLTKPTDFHVEPHLEAIREAALFTKGEKSAK